MNQEKRVWVHFNCLFYYSILPGTVPLVLSLTWKKYSYCLMASALFLYVICFFYTSQKKMVSYGCRMQERGATHSQIVSSTSVWLLLAVSSDFIFEISQTGCTLLPVAYLSLLWVNGLNIPKRSLTQTNRPSPPLPFPYSLCCSPSLRRHLKLFCFVVGWAEELKSPVQAETKTTADTQVILPVYTKKVNK